MQRIAYCIPNFQLDVHSEEGSGRPADLSEDKTEGPNFWTIWRRWMEGQQRGYGNEYEFSGYLVFQAVQE